MSWPENRHPYPARSYHSWHQYTNGEQLSMHLRGPMNVSQIAVYTLATTISSQSDEVPIVLDDTLTPYRNRVQHLKRSGGRFLDTTDNAESAGPGADKFAIRQVNESHSTFWDADDRITSSLGDECNLQPCLETTITTTVYVTAADCDWQCQPSPVISTRVVEPGEPSNSLSLPPPSVIPAQDPCSCNKTSTRPLTILGPSIIYTSSAATPSTFVSVARRLVPSSPPVAEVTAAAVAWRRVAFYASSVPAQATGFAFLANLGDPLESGTFD